MKKKKSKKTQPKPIKKTQELGQTKNSAKLVLFLNLMILQGDCPFLISQ